MHVHGADPHPGGLDEPGHLGLAVLGEHHQLLLAAAHPEPGCLQAADGGQVVRGDQLNGVRAHLAFSSSGVPVATIRPWSMIASRSAYSASSM